MYRYIGTLGEKAIQSCEYHLVPRPRKCGLTYRSPGWAAPRRAARADPGGRGQRRPPPGPGLPPRWGPGPPRPASAPSAERSSAGRWPSSACPSQPAQVTGSCNRFSGGFSGKEDRTREVQAGRTAMEKEQWRSEVWTVKERKSSGGHSDEKITNIVSINLLKQWCGSRSGSWILISLQADPDPDAYPEPCME